MSRRTPVFYRILDSFFRHRWLFLLAVVIVSGVTIAVVTLRGKTYQATALTQVTTTDVASVLGEDAKNNWLTPSQENVNHFNDLINDDLPGGFLDTALKTAGLAVPIEVDPRKNDPRYTALRKKLQAYTQSDSMFAVSLTWDNQAECEEIVQALQKQYIEEVGLDKSSVGIATGRFLDTQIEDFAQRMRNAETALIDYKTKNQGQTPDAMSADISQLSTLKAQLDEAEITAQDSALKRQALEAALKTIPPMSIMEQIQQQSPYEARLNQLKADLDALMARYTSQNPQVIAKKYEITQLQKQMDAKIKANAPEARPIMQRKMSDNPQYREAQSQLTDAKIAEQAQSAQVKNLQARIADYQARVQKMPEAAKILTDKTRDYTILKNQYDRLLTQREEVRLKANLDKVSASSTLSPIGYVYAKATMTRSKKAMMIGGAVLLGLIVGIVLLVLSEWGDSSLRYEGDAEHLLGVPVLAALPDAIDLRYQNGSDAGRRGKKLLTTTPPATPNSAMPAAAMNASATEG